MHEITVSVRKYVETFKISPAEGGSELDTHILMHVEDCLDTVIGIAIDRIRNNFNEGEGFAEDIDESCEQTTLLTAALRQCGRNLLSRDKKIVDAAIMAVPVNRLHKQIQQTISLLCEIEKPIQKSKKKEEDKKDKNKVVSIAAKRAEKKGG